MNFEKFNLTEITHEQVSRFGKGVEIWQQEQDEQSLHVNMYVNEKTFVLIISPYGTMRTKYFLMTLIGEKAQNSTIPRCYECGGILLDEL